MTSYQDIFENNRRWVAAKTRNDADFFVNIARDQTPHFLYIGCSDSRVPADELMGIEPGEVFVHRNVANLVNATDLSVLAVIEYAVRHLHVKHIVVCGHYNCGGVKAAMTARDIGILNPWLQNVRDVYRLHQAELDAITDESARYNRLIEWNVVEQCINVIKIASVQQSYVQNGYPQVDGWVFDLQQGLLKDLHVDEYMQPILVQTQRIYNVTDTNWFGPSETLIAP